MLYQFDDDYVYYFPCIHEEISLVSSDYVYQSCHSCQVESWDSNVIFTGPYFSEQGFLE